MKNIEDIVILWKNNWISDPIYKDVKKRRNKIVGFYGERVLYEGEIMVLVPADLVLEIGANNESWIKLDREEDYNKSLRRINATTGLKIISADFYLDNEKVAFENPYLLNYRNVAMVKLK